MAKHEKDEVMVAEQKALDPKAEAKKAERKAARSRVLEFLAQNADQLGTIKHDIELFIGKGGGSKRIAGATRTVNTDLRDAFLARKTLSEMDIFKQFKIGRPEMVTKIRILVLCPNPDDRVWVKFDEVSETYSVVGTGANPPADWDGYIPQSKATL